MAANVPADLQYSKTHEWLRREGSSGTVGITDHAQQELTDVVYVELPAVGATVQAGEQICVVESVKAASDIYAPLSGTVTAVNEAARMNPALLNTDPFGEGWLFRLDLSDPAETGELIGAADYSALIG